MPLNLSYLTDAKFYVLSLNFNRTLEHFNRNSISIEHPKPIFCGMDYGRVNNLSVINSFFKKWPKFDVHLKSFDTTLLYKKKVWNTSFYVILLNISERKSLSRSMFIFYVFDFHCSWKYDIGKSKWLGKSARIYQ